MGEESYFVYAIQSESTGQIYIGQTADLNRRLSQHNDSANRPSAHTRRHKGPWRLIHYETYLSLAEAIRRERFLKSGKGRQCLKELVASKHQ